MDSNYNAKLGDYKNIIVYWVWDLYKEKYLVLLMQGWINSQFSIAIIGFFIKQTLH